MKQTLKLGLVALVVIFASFTNAQSSDVGDVEAEYKDHTTLVSAIKVADLASTLKKHYQLRKTKIMCSKRISIV